ncbi:MAG: pyrroloquinoline quinone-dependent dehydrogenase [Candidatus Korobacteraceae bacterium]
MLALTSFVAVRSISARHLLLQVLAPLLLVATTMSVPAAAQKGAQDGQWRYYAGDAGSTRYSPLAQIDRNNVKNLEVAWRWKTDNFGPNPEFRSQVTPLMVDGVIYTTAGYRRSVAAVDAATGETLWTYRPEENDQRWRNSPRRNSGRGVSYWTDGTQKRIVYITPGYHLISLDAKTGVPDQKFGDNGVVDLKVGLGKDIDLIEAAIGSSSPPIISRGVVVIGSAFLAGAAPKTLSNAPGHIRGYDVRTGKRLWIFHTIPQPGEFGHETWENGSWKYSGNTGAWAPLTVDEELGYVYMPVEDGTGDWYGGHRHGDNLFSASIVCLDVKTGKRVWHYQLVHHDIWDTDVPAAPVLVDVTVDGRPVKAVAQVSKQAFVYVFDRVTGKPLWPIEERPVPQSDVPGEKTAKTQPFPTKPAPFDLQGLSINDLNDLTPELKEEATKLVKQYRIGPLFTPPSLKEDPSGTKGTLYFPGGNGGALWDSAAVDPETGVLFVTSFTDIRLLGMEKSANSEMNYVRGNPTSLRGPQGLPLTRPPWGRITAIDLNTGNHLWQIPNGETPENVKKYLTSKGLPVPNTGKPVRGGVLATKTLLFAGASERLTGDKTLGAIDKKTGERIATIELPGVLTGTPMTYMVNGVQYLVVMVGSVGNAAELVAFKAPGTGQQQESSSQNRGE